MSHKRKARRDDADAPAAKKPKTVSTSNDASKPSLDDTETNEEHKEDDDHEIDPCFVLRRRQGPEQEKETAILPAIGCCPVVVPQQGSDQSQWQLILQPNLGKRWRLFHLLHHEPFAGPPEEKHTLEY